MISDFIIVGALLLMFFTGYFLGRMIEQVKKKWKNGGF